MNISRAAVLGLILIIPGIASARIGETLAQCETRYGKVVETHKSAGLKGFIKEGYLIMVHFHQDKADTIVYRKREADILDQAKKMSNNEIETLLKANGGDKEWLEQKATSVHNEWVTEDGNLLARYDVFKNMLIISTQEAVLRGEAEIRAKEGKKLEGF